MNMNPNAFAAVYWLGWANEKSGSEKERFLKYARDQVDVAGGLEKVGLSQEEWIVVAGEPYEPVAKEKLGQSVSVVSHTPI